MPALIRSLTTLCLAFLAGTSVARPTSAQEYEQRAPYAALRWQGEAPEVELDSHWHALLAIDGTQVEEIVEFCRKTWPNRWQKRFREDLVEVLTRMQHPPGETVELRVLDLVTGKVGVRKDVPMTKANRETLRATASDPRVSRVDREVDRVQRDHAEKPDERYTYLAQPFVVSEFGMSRAQAQADLDQLEEAMRTGFAYRDRLGVDVEAAFDAVRLACGENVGRGAFADRLQELVALFGDGHSGVSDLPLGKFTPFLAETTSAGIVAFLPDRSGFLDEQHPIFVGIDGQPLEKWLEVAATRVARGAPAYVRVRTLRELRSIGRLRAGMGSSASETIEVDLRSLDGKSTVRKKLALQAQNPVFGAWPREPSRLLDGDVGYLRIPKMTGDRKVLDELLTSMGKFRKARALVIDVRGNGGGTRDVLIALSPFLLRAEDVPLVVNVASPLLPPNGTESSEGLLADRFAYPASWPRWTEKAQSAIAAISRDFKPEWVPPRQPIASWHYFVLDRGDAPAEWTFTGKVVVLMDSACFSATDIFLAALDRLPNVTLVGQPSGGGSGRPMPVHLVHSRLTVELSSMVSYRVDGTLFEGRGVQPDVLVLPAPGDCIGRGDAQLDVALARLR